MGWGWWSGTKWLRASFARIRQVAEKLLADQDPAENLKLAEEVLAKQIRHSARMEDQLRMRGRRLRNAWKRSNDS